MRVSESIEVVNSLSDVILDIGESYSINISSDNFRSPDGSSVYLSISSPHHFTFTSTELAPQLVSFVGTDECVVSVQSSDGFLYIVEDGGSNINSGKIYNVTNPLEAVFLTNVGPCITNQHVFVEDDRLYLSCNANPPEGGVVIYDISDRMNPLYLGSLQIYDARNSYVRNRVAYASSTVQSGTLYGGNVFSGPLSSIWLNFASVSLYPYRLFNHEYNVYGVYESLSEPFLFDIPGYVLRSLSFAARGVFVNDEGAFFTDEDFGLRVYDHSLTSSFGSLDIGKSKSLVVDNKRVFITALDEGLKIIDISEGLSVMKLVFSLPYDSASSNEVVLSQNYLYISECSSMLDTPADGQNGVSIFHFGDVYFETGVFENCGDYRVDVTARNDDGEEVVESFTILVRKDDFYDSNCEVFMCPSGVLSNDTKNFCGGHGLCTIDEDVCDCDFGYDGIGCEIFDCYGPGGPTPNTHPSACYGHGTCIDRYRCKCEANYTVRPECNVCICFGIPGDESSVCSGHGYCESPDHCVCAHRWAGEDCGDCGRGYSGYTKDDCDLNLIMIYSFVIPSGSLIALTVLCCISSCCFIILTIFCVCCCILCCCCLFVDVLGFLVGSQKLRLKHYNKLKDFDILLQEQLLEGDTSVAHLRINNSLFEVPFDEIKTIKIIGEGGSNAMVFLSEWKGRRIAFKCFKTKLLCQNQDKFDEFEAEVEILSSLNHPNIIRFFGASLKPPRVGILMEYCENGEILDFVINYRKNNGTGYLLSSKLRMCSDVCSGMEFIHSRNIIHRDLKPENILLDSNETCKLMDFGISRAVDAIADTSGEKTKRVGTSAYMAPEILSGRYDGQCDVFSFSVFVYALFTERTMPYDDVFQVELRVANDPNFRPKMEPLTSMLSENCKGVEERKEWNWLEKLIEKCWDHVPKNRYTFIELCQIFKEKEDIFSKRLNNVPAQQDLPSNESPPRDVTHRPSSRPIIPPRRKMMKGSSRPSKPPNRGPPRRPPSRPHTSYPSRTKLRGDGGARRKRLPGMAERKPVTTTGYSNPRQRPRRSAPKVPGPEKFMKQEK